MFKVHLEEMDKMTILLIGMKFVKILRQGFQKMVSKEVKSMKIMLVPNIVNITYGRGVGYSFEEEVFDSSVTEISATKIRQKLRDEGKLGLMH
jgi:hypothetical protein